MRSGRTTLAAVVVFASACALATAAAVAQDWRGIARVAGTVNQPDGTSFEGATVTVFRGKEGQGPAPVVTNNKGRFGFLGLGSGQWTVRIEAAGYQPVERVVPLQQAGPPLDAIEITLKPLEEVPEAKQAVRLREQLELGNQLLREGKIDQGRGVLEAVLPDLEDASKPAVLVVIAQTLYDQDQVAAAIARLEQALGYAPDDVAALRLISSMLVSEGRAAEAEPYLARLPADQQKLDPNTLLNQGIAAYNQGDLDQAMGYFEQAVADHPGFADAYYYRGLVHLAQDHKLEARADFTKLLELAPDHANAAEAKQFLEYLTPQ